MKKLTTLFLTLAALTTPALTHAATLSNPLGTSDINVIIGNIIKILLGFSGSIAFLMFVWGGFLWLISAGDPKRVKKGKDTFIWASLGLVVIFTSYVLLRTLIILLGTQQLT
jgi:hypothetical protein